MKGLDTNILIRHLVQDDAAQSRLASHFIGSQCTRERPCFINRIVLCETVWVLESAYEYSRDDISAALERIIRTHQFCVEDVQAAWTALRMYRSGGADFSDCLLGETNREAGCTDTCHPGQESRPGRRPASAEHLNTAKVRSLLSLRFAGLALLVALVPTAAAQSSVACGVHDPELQSTYTGGCRDGWAEGHGDARGSATYQGEFKAGRKHGKGVKTWPGGDRYEGDFVEDRREGTGMYTWGRASRWPGQRYTGGYLNDRRHGYGVYEWPNGDRLAGPWESDRYTGAPSKGTIARARAYAEHAAAVARVGARVCRELEIGVATRDTVRGTVTAVDGERIMVRIDDPGKFESTLNDRVLAKGVVVSDALKFWLPCL